MFLRAFKHLRAVNSSKCQFWFFQNLALFACIACTKLKNLIKHDILFSQLIFFEAEPTRKKKSILSKVRTLLKLLNI